jgi:alpha/beta hydrolase family protein
LLRKSPPGFASRSACGFEGDAIALAFEGLNAAVADPFRMAAVVVVRARSAKGIWRARRWYAVARMACATVTPSVVPRVADGTLVRPDQVRFPAIPANTYGGVARPATRYLRVTNPLHVLGFGAQYAAAASSGVITVEPPRVGPRAYGLPVPQVDADGNDLGGVRSVYLQVPVSTYTGWNLGHDGWIANGFCSLQGTFVPFAATRVERLAVGDPQPSAEEGYPTREAYVAAIRRAAESLVGQRPLLAEDAAQVVATADRQGIHSTP